MSKPGRVFVVGFQKTGTTSVSSALRSLGYRLANVTEEAERSLSRDDPDLTRTIRALVETRVDESDGLEDSPAAFVYDFLDRRYPNSKFILTHRDPELWLKSYRAHFGVRNNVMREWMYGVSALTGNEQRYLNIFERQNSAIREYFRNRSSDFLEMDLARGDGWYELINFLGKSWSGQFPYLNARKAREKRASAVGE